MTPTLERILEEVRSLTPEERGKLREALAEDRAERVRSVMGKYEYLPGSTEEFMARRREDSEREDRSR